MDLIIDGNAFINVAISVTKSLAARDKRSSDSYYVNDLFNDGGSILKEHVRISFRNFCFTYLNSLLAPIGTSLDKVHVVFDSKSWRKEYTTQFFSGADFKTTSAPTEFAYKGNRKYDDHQYLFFDYFQQVLAPVLIEKCGINVYRFKSTEGDDIIAHLCESLSNDVLIYSVDLDLKQLIESSNKNVLLIVPKQMSKTKKLFVPTSYVSAPAVNEVDDFFALDDSSISDTSVEKVVKTLKNKEYAEFKVDATEEVLNKVILGDKSDNVPKITGLTPTKVKLVIDNLQLAFGDQILSLIDSLDESFILKWVDEIKKVNKIKDQDKSDEIREHLLFNIKIIRLSTKIFPEEIRVTLDDFFSVYQMTKFNTREFNNLKNNLSSL